jgi:hypothetical protein
VGVWWIFLRILCDGKLCGLGIYLAGAINCKGALIFLSSTDQAKSPNLAKCTEYMETVQESSIKIFYIQSFYFELSSGSTVSDANLTGCGVNLGAGFFLYGDASSVMREYRFARTTLSPNQTSAVICSKGTHGS